MRKPKKIQEILEDAKISLSINGFAISNLVTYGLEKKNLRSHKKIVKTFGEGKLLNGVETPYLYFEKILREHPEILEKDALIQERTLTYRELRDEVNALSKYLYYVLGCEQGEKISICSDNTIEGIISFLAMNKNGLVNARIFNGSQQERMEKNLHSFDSSTVMFDGTNLDTLTSVIKNTKVKNVIVLPNTDEGIIERFKENNPDIKVVKWFDAINAGKEIKEEHRPFVKNTDIASILYTSGSSGDPKPITIQNKVYTNMVDVVCSTTGIKKCDKEKALGVVSQEYPYAAINSTLMIILMGKTLVLPKVTKGNEIDFNDILDNNIDNIQAIPNFYKLLEIAVQEGKLTSQGIKAVSKIVTGGEKYHLSEKIRLLKMVMKYGCKGILIDGFGFGELGSAAALKFGLSPYFLLMNGIEAKAVNPETLEDLGLDKEGLMMFTGPTIAQGYWDNEEATKKSFIKDKDGKVWFVSDTYGSIHGKNRRLFKLGARIREYFITGDGKGSFVKVYSGNVEDMIISTGLVEDCIVIQSDTSANPKPVAYVSLRTDANMSKEEVKQVIIERCHQLEEFARPIEINYEDTIARTPAEKKDYGLYKKRRNIN